MGYRKICNGAIEHEHVEFAERIAYMGVVGELVETCKKILSIFDFQEKVQAVRLLLLMCVGAVFEVIGVGVVLPLILVVRNPEQVLQHESLLPFLQVLHIDDAQTLLLAASSAVLLVYILRNGYLGFMYYTLYRFVFKQQVNLSQRLLESYLRQPYTFHLQSNTAQLLKNVTEEVRNFSTAFMQPLVIFIAEFLVLILLFGLLLVFQPLVTLGVMLVLGGPAFLFYRSVRRRLREVGQTREYHFGQMIQGVNQALGGIKETKILGGENFFLGAYLKNSLPYTSTLRTVAVLNQFPRLFIEVATVGGLLVVVLLVLIQEGGVQSVFPLLGMFSIAAIRLTPSVIRILAAINSLRFAVPSAHVICRDLALLQGPAISFPDQYFSAHGGTPLSFQHEVVVDQVSYRYPSAQREAVMDISLTIPKGHSVALIGASGSGKTTLVDIILGLLPPIQGRVLVDGCDIHTNYSGWLRHIGYIPQSIYLTDDSIRRNVAFGVSDEDIDDRQVWKVLRAVQLEELVIHLSQGLDTSVGERGVRVSGGERQRLGIARALYHNPEVLVLDEATAALDGKTEREITNVLNQLSGKKTLIIIAHRLTTVRRCDRLYLMDQGKIVDSGTFDELAEKNKDFQRMLDLFPERVSD